ncbi:hypothetical protein [Maledivibacter halophilus]|uniref:MinD-like ATPase involved in chromosome partitioning or flagellar assembly n=1 Tax=Maledivibacter halophilus TaxID=36842 RepID=A0A1T5LSB7_9FIRM|nr:hypothetical protein [Maledivibacter halophilus]SKC78791.1 MinD-like ATPase involved in chromosome partitioning or flagellar assembly [Maledivibacter halophilus]
MKKVLLAFDDLRKINQVKNKLKDKLEKRGFLVRLAKEISLQEIEKLLDEEGDYSILILKENFQFDNYINEYYLFKISNKFSNLNMVCIIDNKHYGSNCIRELFERNIYNCIFTKDASIENIVYISINPRLQDEAKGYYGLYDNFTDTKKEDKYFSKLPIGFTKKKVKKMYRDDKVIIKEKVVYKTPRDYQKIIGIYSPYSAGKTVIAANLAKCYTKNKLTVGLIDTDYYKKDLIYYFPLKNSDFLKMLNLYKDLEGERDTSDISSYGISIGKRLTLFSDHRDSIYKITYEMVNSIVRNCVANIIIIDISKDLDNTVINEILSLCDERIIVADKMLSTLNGLPYKLSLKRFNRRNISLIINRDVNIKNLSNMDIIKHFKHIELFGKEKYSLNFDEIFFIPNNLELIAEALARREVAYGKDKDFDESIEKIAATLYKISALKSNKRSLLGKLFKEI